MSETIMRQLLSMAEVNQLTGVSIDTLRRWRLSGEGPRSFKCGRRVVYDRTEIDAWINSLRQAG